MSFAKAIPVAALALSLPMAAEAFEIRSDHPGFLAQATSELGFNPDTRSEENACYPASDDFSVSGKIVAAQDWIITSEVEAHGFEFVAFAGIAEALPEGRCQFTEGYVSIYRDGQFLGLIENANTDHQLLATIRLMDDGTLAIHPSSSSTPVASIRYSENLDQILVSAP